MEGRGEEEEEEEERHCGDLWMRRESGNKGGGYNKVTREKIKGKVCLKEVCRVGE